MKDHYEERIGYARKSDDFEGRVSEIVKAFLRDVASGVVTGQESRAIAEMLNEASCEAAMAVTS